MPRTMQFGRGHRPHHDGAADGAYDRLVLMSDHGQQKTQNFVAWLSAKFTGTTEVRYAKLRSPTDFEDIYVASNGAVSAALSFFTRTVSHFPCVSGARK